MTQRNDERLTVLRWCPNCDPRALNPIMSLPAQCSCSHELCVYTEHSGKVEDRGQYAGPRERYSILLGEAKEDTTLHIPTCQLINRCPHCKSEQVTAIFRPEVYEFSFCCRDCGKGFN